MIIDEIFHPPSIIDQFHIYTYPSHISVVLSCVIIEQPTQRPTMQPSAQPSRQPSGGWVMLFCSFIYVFVSYVCTVFIIDMNRYFVVVMVPFFLPFSCLLLLIALLLFKDNHRDNQFNCHLRSQVDSLQVRHAVLFAYQ